MTALHLEKLTVTRKSRKIIDQVDLAINPGEFVGLIGPNGAGKTTLLRAALGLLPISGQSNLAAKPLSERARLAAFIPQSREIAWPMPVEALVALGRIAHPSAATDTDHAAIERALTALNLGPLRHRPATELSGGEQTRALIARALAQETPILIADEPITGLDPAAQIGVMRLFSQLAVAGGTVMASLHDLGLAARHCTRLILLDHGRLVADGPPKTVLTQENLAQVFGITGHLSDGPAGPVFYLQDTVDHIARIGI